MEVQPYLLSSTGYDIKVECGTCNFITVKVLMILFICRCVTYKIVFVVGGFSNYTCSD